MIRGERERESERERERERERIELRNFNAKSTDFIKTEIRIKNY